MSSNLDEQKALADYIAELNESYRRISHALDIAEAELPDDHMETWRAARHAAWCLLVDGVIASTDNAADLAAALNSAARAEEDS